MIVSCVPVKEKANTNTKVGYSRGRRAEKYSQRIAFFVTDGSCHITLLKNGLIIQALCHREGSLAFSVLSTIYIDQPRRPFTLKHRSWICNSFCLWYWFMPADHFTAPACRLLETTIQFCLCLLPCVGHTRRSVFFSVDCFWFPVICCVGGTLVSLCFSLLFLPIIWLHLSICLYPQIAWMDLSSRFLRLCTVYLFWKVFSCHTVALNPSVCLHWWRNRLECLFSLCTAAVSASF